MKEFLIGMGCVSVTAVIVESLQAYGYEFWSAFFLGGCVMSTFLVGRRLK